MSDEVDIVNPKKSSNKQPNNMAYKIILGVIAVFIIAGISFYGGIAYQKGHTTTSNQNASGTGTGGQGRFGGFGGRFGGGRTIGTVSAISSSSITVQSQTGTSKTFSINSSTVISDNGSTVSASTISTGSTVFVTTSSTTSTTASRILVNPSFGGFGGGGGANSGSSTGSGSSSNSGTSNDGSVPNVNSTEFN